MKLKDKVAIITGGSKGIGGAIAGAFVNEGANVIIAARSSIEFTDTVNKLKILRCNNVLGIQTDVAEIDHVEKLIKKTIDIYGTIDILVNAAGIQFPIGPFTENKIDDWINNIKVNLLGTMYCCKFVLPLMIAKKSGKIINFSGGGAASSRPYFSAYACSKTAVVRFTEIIAEEVKEFGIDVNAIAPGAVNTNMLQDVLSVGEEVAGKKEFGEAVKREKEGGVLPEIPANLSVFLASDKSNGITGKFISAPWDPWGSSDFIQKLKTDKDFATLRRIDDKTFFKRG